MNVPRDAAVFTGTGRTGRRSDTILRTVTPQQTIAHYRITSKLGEGGMGEVWRATDGKLGREVAIKVLPPEFAADADRMARFQREAQVLASLNHPNIAAIYGVEERALVMELVDGPTLADRIAQGPIPIDETLQIAGQIADALEFAHERGIVHRDLKPANIKLTRDRVKVLDFGLAKAMTAQRTPGDAMASPTLTMRATQAGVILGTAAYMAPEQARGQDVDARADIWAFGVTLYEMLTGKAPFAGPTISDTLAAVLTRELDLDAIPERIRPALERCLRKDPRRRWRAIGDVRMALEEGIAGPAAQTAPAPERRRAMPWVAAAVMALAAGAGWFAAWRATRPADRPLIRLSVDLGPEAVPGFNLTAAISRDGRRIVFPARGADGKQRLATRLLDQTQSIVLPGTEDGRDPFFSPDGEWIGFFANGYLKKTSVQGGVPIVLGAGATTEEGANWGEDGNIAASMGVLVPLSSVPAGGGPITPLTKLTAAEITHRWPQWLPGGNAILFTACYSAIGLENSIIQATSVKTGAVKTLLRGGYYARYLPSGHLVYVSHGVLYGVKFDASRLETIGTPAPLVQDLAGNPISGGGQFDFSDTGVFVYLAGKSETKGWLPAWLDGSGKMQPILATPGAYGPSRISPDGRKFVFLDSADLYVHDLERDTTTRLTFGEHSGPAVWAPDGKHLAFQSAGNSVFWMRSDGAGTPYKLLESGAAVPWSFSPDGRQLLYFVRGAETGIDIWSVALDLSDPEQPKVGKPAPFLVTPADELLPRFSPDGRWVAYRSHESGTPEIYVRPFPASDGGKWQISSGGGIYAMWSGNGRELYYETPDTRIMAVPYSAHGGSFLPGRPRVWSDRQIDYSGTSNLDAAPDGKRMLVFMPAAAGPGAAGSAHVTMLLNFFDELKRRLP